jgi:uncharacterized membrane protein YphA (DoxX/SURF4 family)
MAASMTDPKFDDPLPPRPRRSPVLELFRIGLGIIWALNLVFILDPANGFFASFSATASSFAPTSAGGPGLANFVAGHPLLFAGLIAGTTAYLAIAFLLGFTTRMACLVGAIFNSVLLVTQFGTVATIGGTDVGPMPLYLVLYLGLAVGGAGASIGVDGWLWRSGLLHLRSMYQWIGSPPPASIPTRTTRIPTGRPRPEPNLPA